MVILKGEILLEGYCSRVLMLLRQELLHLGGFPLDMENRSSFGFGNLYLNCEFVTCCSFFHSLLHYSILNKNTCIFSIYFIPGVYWAALKLIHPSFRSLCDRLTIAKKDEMETGRLNILCMVF